MATITAASLVNLLGFVTGVVLYVMLLWMVLTYRAGSDRLALVTGVLGLAWNVGAFSGYGLFNLGFDEPGPLFMAGALGALCFLPAVVVHSALRNVEKVGRREILLIVGSGYALSSIATLMQFFSALRTNTVPSQSALIGVTIGFAILLVALLVITRGQNGRASLLWIVAMSIFAVSALHLSVHKGVDPWWLQLAGHHASLPLALLILYNDFRFALADIFLKRALAFIFLAGLIFAVFTGVAAQVLSSGEMTPRSNILLMAIWISTALVYPYLRLAAEWFVDKIVLKRADYADLLTAVFRAIDRCQTLETVVDEVFHILGAALSARSIDWEEAPEGEPNSCVDRDRQHASVKVPTTERPQYLLSIRDFSGGRRLLSDDIRMLEGTALLIARRVDAIRSMQERYRRDLQEQEMRKLAAEAELRALRAQINPHFLFNALTTIGYLIQTSPDRALGTLMRLSGLLRRVLKSGEEFVSFSEELDLIEAYVDIERARFEDRLRVLIDVPRELRRMRIPALVIQPLVENAIKHGISERLAGGEVRISARLEQPVRDGTTASLLISVTDTGMGFADSGYKRRSSRGFGLTSIEQRLQRYGSGPSPVSIQSTPGSGTNVTIRVQLQPADLLQLSSPLSSAAVPAASR